MSNPSTSAHATHAERYTRGGQSYDEGFNFEGSWRGSNTPPPADLLFSHSKTDWTTHSDADAAVEPVWSPADSAKASIEVSANAFITDADGACKPVWNRFSITTPKLGRFWKLVILELQGNADWTQVSTLEAQSNLHEIYSTCK